MQISKTDISKILLKCYKYLEEPKYFGGLKGSCDPRGGTTTLFQ